MRVMMMMTVHGDEEAGGCMCMGVDLAMNEHIR